MSFCVVVPARLESTRLPGKALADIGGAPMIVRVLDRARDSGAARVVAATDSDEIAAAAARAGHEVALTGRHDNGTARVAAAAASLQLDGVVVNVQGDEPEIDPGLIAAVAARAGDGGCDCATAAAPIDAEEAADPMVVKVVTDRAGTALLFSRAALPRPAGPKEEDVCPHLGHMGIYAFAPGRLAAAVACEPCPLERAERLEQLRWLWHGWKIAVVSADSFSTGVDTPADLDRVRSRLAASP